MAFDPNSDQDMSRLRDAISASLQDLKPFREHYHTFQKETVGIYWSSNGSKKVVPVNLMELASTIYLQNLMGAPPRCNCTTADRRVRPAGNMLAQVVNNHLAAVEFDTSSVYRALQRAVRSSLGTVGVVKVGLMSAGTIEVDGFLVEKNVPFVRHIHIDDWIQDMAARTIDSGEFEGHQFEMELDEALNNPEFNDLAKKHLSASEDLSKGFEGQERSSALQGTKANRQPFKRTVQLVEIFLPKEQLVITMSMEGNGPPLKVQQWTGPQHGPYHKLWYAEVDGNSMPLPPQALWLGLHKIVNGLFRKMDRQSSRQKVVTAFQGIDEKDAIKFMKASDGDGIVVENPQAVHEISQGGIDQRNFAFMIQSRDLFSWLAGNLDTMGGLSPGARTATQDELLNQNSGQRMAMMAQNVMMFTRSVLTDYAFYLWQDPVQSYPVEISVPGYGTIQDQLKPQERTHDFFMHNLMVEPYSMVFQTPAQRAAKIFQVVSQFLLPASPLLSQSGITIDWGTLLRQYSEAMQLPELEACIDQGGMPLDASSAAPQNPQKQAAPPAMPQQTTRNYNRTSSPGVSGRQQGDNRLVAQMMGGGVQKSEM